MSAQSRHDRHGHAGTRFGHSVQMGPTDGHLPQDPTLAAVVAAWRDAGHVALAVDDQWRLAAFTDDGASGGFEFVVGDFLYGPAQIDMQLKGHAGSAAPHSNG